MIQIGQFKFGFAVASTLIVFIVLSISAVGVAVYQATSEGSMPIGSLIVVNEGMALLATLIYGIFAHFALALINKIKDNQHNNASES